MSAPKQQPVMTLAGFLSLFWSPDEAGEFFGIAIIDVPITWIDKKTGKTKSGFRHHYPATLEDALALVRDLETQGADKSKNVYFAMTLFREMRKKNPHDPKSTGSRGGDNAHRVRALWLDVDCGADKPYANQAEGWAAFQAFLTESGLPKPTVVVNSGNGIHIYWCFERFIKPDAWLKLAEKLQRLCVDLGFQVDPSRTTDIASVLRVPETHNYKDPASPKPVEIKNIGSVDGSFVDLADFENHLDAALAAVEARVSDPSKRGNGITRNDREDFPPSSAVEINKRCPTLGHVAKVGGAVSEPLWRAALGVWKHTSEGEAFCHNLSKGDPRYDEAETQDKIDRWTTGPTCCDTFQKFPEAKCTSCSHMCTSPISLGRAAPIKVTLAQGGDGVTLDQFRAYMPMHQYIFMPTCELWPAASVNARFGSIPLFDDEGEQLVDAKGKKINQIASLWLDQNRAVEQMTWAPGESKLIENRLVANGGWMPQNGATIFNQYIPPRALLDGDPAEAGPWLDHVRRIYPGDADHIVNWLAHRVQRPGQKINHALVLGGAQGIGKDTILEPVKVAIGPWNFQEVGPQQLLGSFNGYLKSVILRVSEARDLGDVDRFAFYDHMKTYTASPPDVLRVNEKHLREYYIFNVCGVIITTNHKTDGIYLPSDDRRHYVAWSERDKADFSASYWNALWKWYANGGLVHVAAYLSGLDISAFDPKAPPPKTPAFWAIADANRAPEDAELADTLESLKWPDAVTLHDIKHAAGVPSEFYAWLDDRRNRRAIPHRMEKAGYVPVRNDADKSDGMWKVNGSRVVVYAKKTLSTADQMTAARRLAKMQQPVK